MSVASQAIRRRCQAAGPRLRKAKQTAASRKMKKDLMTGGFGGKLSKTAKKSGGR